MRFAAASGCATATAGAFFGIPATAATRTAGTAFLAHILAWRVSGSPDIDTGARRATFDAVDRGTRDKIAVKGDGTAGVVVPRDNIVNAVRITIAVHDGDHGYAQLL